MCCLIAALFMLGPRAALFIWWLIEPVRWAAAFDTVLWPLAGFIALPWTTLMYLATFQGGIDGFDYVWLGFGLMFDLFTWFGGGYTNKDRIPTATA